MANLKSWFWDDEELQPEGFCASIGLVGLVLVLLGLGFVWTTGWGKDLFVPGATLLTVALTAWVASRAVVKWTEQRERDRQAAEYKHREEVYEQLVTFMLGRITGGAYDEELDKQLRAKAAVWGSAQIIGALANWQTQMTAVLDNHAHEERKIMTEDEGKTMRDALGRALEAMRKDLSSSNKNAVSRSEILKSIFNQ
ncbi:hypothetical protein [Paenarthrobacter ureafaciens]|uniref:hypothetical protein n=1 Tax=Paenarthrobacter ureafaciens TaxID=37931 RepID=UPI001FB40641|nr:hypothetical protein [Paenarthrobacter ureafaciens]UOD80341.1 hypothetical protein MQZ73_14630 [Paenarthrobacter ureafaciens]WNZ02994.1 hypothetical protein PVT25_15270 [Paenarthrobacter ureafaciens]